MPVPASQAANREIGARLNDNARLAVPQTDCSQDGATKTPLEVERSYHETFLEVKALSFVGRRTLLDTLHTRVGTMTDVPELNKPLIVSGEAGSGKTSLIAAFVREVSWDTQSCLAQCLPPPSPLLVKFHARAHTCTHTPTHARAHTLP